jgi:hypothetical protein
MCFVPDVFAEDVHSQRKAQPEKKVLQTLAKESPIMGSLAVEAQYALLLRLKNS